MVLARQILYVALALILAAGLVAPLSADSAASPRTPICCLGKGKHHCLGMDSARGAPHEGFSSVREKCPYTSLALAALHGPDLAPAVAARAMVAPSHVIPVEPGAASSSYASVVYTRPERGPPAFSFC